MALYDHLSISDQELVDTYIELLSAKRDLKENTVRTLKSAIKCFVFYVQPLESINFIQILRGIKEIRDKYSLATARKMIDNGFAFLKWYEKDHPVKINWDEINEIKKPNPPNITKTAAQMLSKDEILQIIDHALNARDRAIFSLMYEGAFRPIEIRKLTWDCIHEDQRGIIINTIFTENNRRTTGKTDFVRGVRIIDSLPYLKLWRQEYPGDPKGNNLVFMSRYGNQLGRTLIREQLLASAKRAGITKNVTPYLFRHSRITHMMVGRVPHHTIMKIGWGHLNTNMLARYGHLSDSDVDKDMLRFAGIEIPDDTQVNPLKAIICPRCNESNIPSANYCIKCMMGLTPGAVAEQERMMRSILMHPEILEEYKR